MFGQLVPLGGGDVIPLLRAELLVGRRESCDVVLRFSNVSAHHCELNLRDGYWYVKDLQSRNGTKVNSVRVTERFLEPPPMESVQEEIMKRSLLQRAGLDRSSAESQNS